MTEAILHLSGVKVKRGGRFVLDIDHLEIPAGTFVGIVGTNGAGKTTLLKVCCGLIRPTTGTVMLADAHLHTISSWQRTHLRRDIGYVPQQAEYNAELPFTVREVVAMGRVSTRGMLRRLSRDGYKLVDEWIERIGLGGQAMQTFASLSGGEQQKVLIARAMVQQPSILMLDEPGSNLDFNWKYELSRIVDKLFQQTRRTVLMVSHETNLLPPSCQRVVLLHRGRVLADGDTDEVLSSGEMAQAYECKVRMVEIAGRRYTAVEEGQ